MGKLQVGEKELRAGIAWVHITNDLIKGGDSAKMGPSAFQLYVTLKVHADFETGEVRLLQKEIQRLTGQKDKNTRDNLKLLCEMGYLRKEPGRPNKYFVIDKIPISEIEVLENPATQKLEKHERKIGVATSEYAPLRMKAFAEELTKALRAGLVDENGKPLHFANFNLQLNINPHISKQNNDGSGIKIQADISDVGPMPSEEELKARFPGMWKFALRRERIRRNLDPDTGNKIEGLEDLSGGVVPVTEK